MDMMTGQTRTFISVELPHPDDFKSITDTLKGIPGVKITPLNQLHITLSFLGDVVDISRIIDDHRDDEFLNFDCSSINVMKSVLKPTGAEHSVICTIPLKQNV